MVAYSFKPQFARPIIVGSKRQTIRNDRKRHARVGEQIQLFTGMRTKACRRLGAATCTLVMRIEIELKAGRVRSLETGAEWTGAIADRFARRDGFSSWRELRLFWEVTHPTIDIFSGVLIAWGETFEAAHV